MIAATFQAPILPPPRDLAQLGLVVEGVPLQHPEVERPFIAGHPVAVGGLVGPADSCEHGWLCRGPWVPGTGEHNRLR